MEGERYAGRRRAVQEGKQRYVGTRLRAPGWLGPAQQGLLFLLILVVAGCQGADPHPTQGVLKHGVPQSARGTGGAVIQQAESWRTFGYDAAAGQVNASENVLTAANVRYLRQAWSVTLPDLADERPILLRHLAWPDGTFRDVLYLTTDDGMLLALDPQHTPVICCGAAPSRLPAVISAPSTGRAPSWSRGGCTARMRRTT